MSDQTSTHAPETPPDTPPAPAVAPGAVDTDSVTPAATEPPAETTAEPVVDPVAQQDDAQQAAVPQRETVAVVPPPPVPDTVYVARCIAKQGQVSIETATDAVRRLPACAIAQMEAAGRAGDLATLRPLVAAALGKE